MKWRLFICFEVSLQSVRAFSEVFEVGAMAPSLLLKQLPALAGSLGSRRYLRNTEAVRFGNAGFRSVSAARGAVKCGSKNVSARFRSTRSSSSFNEESVVESPPTKSMKLILYSKPGCCLCDGLEEKLLSRQNVPGIELEVRDITTNSDWWDKFQYEIPVLAIVRDDGNEESLPRLSPRLSAEQVHKKIRTIMTSGF